MFHNQFVLCVRYRTKKLEASEKPVGLKKNLFFYFGRVASILDVERKKKKKLRLNSNNNNYH